MNSLWLALARVAPSHRALAPQADKVGGEATWLALLVCLLVYCIYSECCEIYVLYKEGHIQEYIDEIM